MTDLLILFAEFFKTGLFAIGGGLATIPFLYDLADKYTWFTLTELADMIAVSESTPGPIGVNMATYAGFNAYGIPGALIATIGLVLPSVIIIIIIAKFLGKFNENFYVKSAFYALRPAVTALVAVAGLEVFKISILALERFTTFTRLWEIFDPKAFLLFITVLFFNLRFKKLHPLVFIVSSAIIGVILKL